MTSVRLQGNFRVIAEAAQPSAKYVGWRFSNNPNVPLNMPYIIPPDETRALTMTEAIQRMSYALMQYFCPPIPKGTWRNCHRHDKAMNNGAQNGYDGGIAHRDYINGRDLTSITHPRYDKQQRGFINSFIHGVDEGDRVRCDPGVHGIDATKPMPSVQTIVENNWYVVAVNNTSPNLSHWAQGYINGTQYPIVFPFIFDRPIYFLKKFLAVWESDSLPDPLQTYGVTS